MSNWIYKPNEGLGIDVLSIDNLPNHEEAVGFVYKITNTVTGRFYIGRKNLYSERKTKISNREKTQTKTRKTFKRVVKESNWKTYYGSNKHLKADVEKHGEGLFTREILHLCKTRGECAYLEAKEQFDRGVLLTDDYYNGIIQIKLGGNAIKTLYK